MIERWNHQETEHREPFERKPFVSIDPGRDGWALAWEPQERAPVGFCHAYDPMALVELAALVQAKAFVVESQYIHRMNIANSVLDLAFRMGMSLGWLAAAMHSQGGLDLHLFQVSPSTWQAHQRKLAGIERRLERGEGIQLALELAENLIGTEAAWRKARKPQKEGLASALGLGVWWRSLWPAA